MGKNLFQPFGKNGKSILVKINRDESVVKQGRRCGMANVIFTGTYSEKERKDLARHGRKTRKNTYRCSACNKKICITSAIKKNNRCPFCNVLLSGGIIQEL